MLTTYNNHVNFEIDAHYIVIKLLVDKRKSPLTGLRVIDYLLLQCERNAAPGNFHDHLNNTSNAWIAFEMSGVRPFYSQGLLASATYSTLSPQLPFPRTKNNKNKAIYPSRIFNSALVREILSAHCLNFDSKRFIIYGNKTFSS